MRIGRRLVLAGIVALALGMVPALPVTAADPGVHSVTLITGDRVVLRPDGSHSVLPAAGRERIPFSTSGNGDHLYVVPADAAPLVTAGTFAAYLNTGWTAGDAYYGLAWSWDDALPTGITKAVRQADLATVHQRIAGGGEVEMSPDPLSRYVNSPGLVHEAGGTAYVTTRGVRWTTTVSQPDTMLVSPPRTYRAGGPMPSR
jgi:hypothetical protein